MLIEGNKMDNLLQTLLTWQFILFSLGIAAITEVIRRGIEFFILDNPKMPGTRASKFWREFLLPIAPYVNGILIAFFATKFPYPEGIDSVSAREFFGLVAGAFSGLTYRVITGLLKNKAPASSEELNDLVSQIKENSNSNNQ